MVVKGAIEIAAKGGFLYAQAVEEVYSQSGKDRSCKRFLGFKSCNLFGSKTRDWTKSQVKNRVTEFTAEEDINLWARDDITLEASKMSTRKNAKITSQQGSVNFRAVKDRHFEQVIGKSSGFFLTHNDTGYIEDTWALPSLYIGGELSIDPSYAISADIKANNRQSIDNVLTSLSHSEGSEWLAQLKDNDNVRWDLVYDAYDDWDHETKQLNPVVSAVIAIAVAAATYGTGLAASAGASAVTATGTTGVTAATVSGMASAGIAGLTSQAAVALVESEGNIFNAFLALGNSDTVKSLASQMIIGGALNGLDVYMGWKADPTLASSSFDAVDPTQFQIPSLTHYQWNDVARRIAAQSAILTTTHSALHGGSFIDNFKTALTSSIANQLHADGAQYIGDSAEYLGQGGKILSHATVAGIAAEIRGGNVKGAMVGSLAAELAGVLINDNLTKTGEWQEQQAQISRMAGALTGLLATGEVSGIHSGANAAEIIERYNRQLHIEELKAIDEIANGDKNKKERLLAASCRKLSCVKQESLASTERKYYETMMAKYPETVAEDIIISDYWIKRARRVVGNYPVYGGFEAVKLFTYSKIDSLTDGELFVRNQSIENLSKMTGWSPDKIESLAQAMSIIGMIGGKKSAKTPTGSKGNPLNIPDGINKPIIIGNRNFSGHALDRMQRQGIPPTAVNNAIKLENAISGKRPGTTAYYDNKNNLTVITDTKSGTVITVDYGKIKQ